MKTAHIRLGEFLWEEMSIDIDELYIERLHRLGSIQKARQRVTDPNEPVRRPIIVAFNDTRSLNRVLDNAHMLRGKPFSVTRDYPLEIVKARRTLMPQYIKEKQNRQNKVSMEYPARLIVNGKTVSDAFPDWYTVLQQDRYEIATTLGQTVIGSTENTASVNSVQNEPHQVNYTHQPPQPPPTYHLQFQQPPSPPPQPQMTQPIVRPTQTTVVQNAGATSINTPRPGPQTYSQIVSAGTQAAPRPGAPINTRPAISANVPRYTAANITGAQQVNTQRSTVTSTSSMTSGNRSGSVNNASLTNNTVNVERDHSTFQQL